MPGIVRSPHRIAPGRVSDALTTSIDLLPTLAACCGAAAPGDRTIDGRDISAIWFDHGTASPHEAAFYYWMNDLEAVRVGRWKLHFSKRGKECNELYDLDADIGETTDVAAEHGDVVTLLRATAERAHGSPGDARLGIAGADVRPVSRVEKPRPLTRYDPEHPYYIAEYDLGDRG